MSGNFLGELTTRIVEQLSGSVNEKEVHSFLPED